MYSWYIHISVHMHVHVELYMVLLERILFGCTCSVADVNYCLHAVLFSMFDTMSSLEGYTSPLLHLKVMLYYYLILHNNMLQLCHSTSKNLNSICNFEEKL